MFLRRVHYSYIFCFDFEFRFLEALVILVWNIILSLFMMLLDLPQYIGGMGMHTYLLLNAQTANSNPRKGYMHTEVDEVSTN